MLYADRYDCVSPPFVGGMATVFCCKDSILDRQIAIKVMPGGPNLRRARDELAALLRMRSKHVVQIYDVLPIESNNLAIVQEFIDGKDLFDASLMPKTSTEYLKLIWQISSGIADIHDLKIIHRDIKPNNMKIDPEGVVKIFDFGLSRDEGQGASTVGFVGTPGFAAPELYNNYVEFTSAVDTYAFGATALFLDLQDLPSDLKRRPPMLSGVNYFDLSRLGLPGDIAATLYSCLNPDPNHRPAMGDVRDLLAKHLLFDRHKALVVFEGKSSYLDSAHRSVVLNLPSVGEVEIHYDGLYFQFKRVLGEVFVNNLPVSVGDELPGACVVTLGAPERMNRRKYVTFDLSHPEIVL